MANPAHLEFMTMLDRVDPALQPILREAFTPKGTCKLATSAHFVYVVGQYLRGFSPVEISKSLEEERREFIPPTVIRDYMLQYVPASLQRSNLILKYLQGMVAFDEVDLMESLVKIQTSRILGKLDKALPNADAEESARRDIDLAQKMACNLLEMKIKTGRVKEQPKKVEVDVNANSSSTQVVEHRVVSEKLDPRSASRILNAIHRLAGVPGVPLPEGEPDGSTGNSGSSGN